MRRLLLVSFAGLLVGCGGTEGLVTVDDPTPAVGPGSAAPAPAPEAQVDDPSPATGTPAAPLTRCPTVVTHPGDPALPRVVLDSRAPLRTGTTLEVRAGDDLQAALDAARPGDEVVLEAGATFTGHFVLRAKAGEGVVVVRGAPLDALPPEGVRMTPAAARAVRLAKLLTPDAQPLLTTAPGARGYRLVGLELGPVAGKDVNDLVVFGSATETDVARLASNLVVDRCYVHGDPSVGGKRGVQLNSASTAIVDSTFEHFMRVGQDSQAVAGWNGPGPYQLANNAFVAAGENVMFGGADAVIPNLIPADIEVCGNHFVKPLAWKSGEPEYDGSRWQVKNPFELKVGRRVLVAGNVFENSWVAAQVGFAVLIKTANQDGREPWAITEDVTAAFNVIRHAAGGVALHAADTAASQKTRNVRFVDDVLYDIGGSRWGGIGRMFQITNGVANITLEHLTGLATHSAVYADGPANPGFVYRNNLVTRGQYGIMGGGVAEGTSTLASYFPGADVRGNAIIGASASRYPGANLFPADTRDVGFVDAPAFDLRLDAHSPLRMAGVGGEDVGADVDEVLALTRGVAP